MKYSGEHAVLPVVAAFWPIWYKAFFPANIMQNLIQFGRVGPVGEGYELDRVR
jgi:hypothetical protein